MTHGPKFSPYTASWLQGQEFPETQWVVHSLLPEGLCVFVAKSKLGKTWLAMGAGRCIAQGGPFLGFYRTEPGEVLYLDLDQRHPRRTRRRLERIFNGSSAGWPERLHLENEVPRIGETGHGSQNLFLDALHAWCSGKVGNLVVEKPRLVVVDTAGVVWPRKMDGGNAYYAEYALLDSIRKLAAEFPGLCIMMVHHESKAVQTDTLDRISGTAAWAAAADTIWILSRDREKRQSELFVTGKEVEETRLHIRFDAHIGGFCRTDERTGEDAWYER